MSELNFGEGEAVGEGTPAGGKEGAAAVAGTSSAPGEEAPVGAERPARVEAPRTEGEIAGHGRAWAEQERREALARYLAAEGQRVEQAEFHRRWWETAQREMEAIPELKDENSDMRKTLQGVLQETPLYATTHDGFRQAAALAKARHLAGTVPGLQARIEALAKENERLVKLTSVSGSGPAKMSGEAGRDFSERDLRRMAAEMDAM